MSGVWHRVLAETDLPVDTMKNVSIGDKKILIVNAAGRFYAVNHFCTHDDIALSLGCIKGDTIKCSLHGAIFNLADGKVLADPAEEALQTWPVQIVDGQIQVYI